MRLDLVSDATLAWFCLLAVASVAASAYYWFGASARRKRATYPVFIILCGIEFVCWVKVGGDPPPRVFTFVVVWTAFVAIWSIFAVTFCPQCARVARRGLFSRGARCPRCGADLGVAPPAEK